jgi:4'-phosphopantetheinyl transferase EntD
MRLSAEVVRRGLPLPVGVGVRHVTHPHPGATEPVPPPLYGIEEQVLGPRAVAERRALFALGRAAARDALLELGLEATAIGRGEGGQPLWPAGVVGAISHSRQVAVAVVGRRRDYLGLGVDVEDITRELQPAAARLVCRPAELEWVDVASGTRRLLMLFSAKESIFKALYPIEGVWLGFDDAELTWQAERGVFRARVLKRVGAGLPAGLELEVSCTLGATWVVTSTYVASRQGGAST